MTPLDINTPAGQATLPHEQRAASLFVKHTGFKYCSTPKNSAACLDAVITHCNDLRYGAETKARAVTHDQLMRQFGGTWLLSYNKLTTAQRFSGLMAVPVLGLLYLVPDDTLIVVRLTNADATLACRFRLERTTTSAGVNGGTALRDNAYIDITSARKLTATRTPSDDFTYADIAW
jgi:hypothetical protein